MISTYHPYSNSNDQFDIHKNILNECPLLIKKESKKILNELQLLIENKQI